MDKMDKQRLLQTVETARSMLIGMIDSKFEFLIRDIENSDGDISVGNISQEKIYPLFDNLHIFKGTKPITLIRRNKQIAVKTWREVYIEILKWCDHSKHDELMELRNKIGGRKRKFLSDNPDGMNTPIMIDENLYAEAYFDTEFLIRTLFEILNAVQYNHRNIFVEITERKKKFR